MWENVPRNSSRNKIIIHVKSLKKENLCFFRKPFQTGLADYLYDCVYRGKTDVYMYTCIHAVWAAFTDENV